MKRIVVVGLVCAASVLFVQCGDNSKKCDSTTCSTGCCDSTGTCQSGNTQAQCGGKGTACTACAGSNSCTEQVCRTPSGCRSVGAFSGTPFVASYANGANVTIASVGSPDPATVSEFKQATLEVWHARGATVPSSLTLDGGQTAATCVLCAKYGESCTLPPLAGLTCLQDYLLQTGTISVSKADKNPDAGELVGSVSGTFVKWDFVNDRAAANGDCVVIDSVDLNVHWNDQDGGIGGTGGGQGGAGGSGGANGGGEGGGLGGNGGNNGGGMGGNNGGGMGGNGGGNHGNDGGANDSGFGGNDGGTGNDGGFGGGPGDGGFGGGSGDGGIGGGPGDGGFMGTDGGPVTRDGGNFDPDGGGFGGGFGGGAGGSGGGLGGAGGFGGGFGGGPGGGPGAGPGGGPGAGPGGGP